MTLAARRPRSCLTGVPQKFILCTADAQCAAAGGTTCNIAGQYCDVGGSILGCDATQGCTAPGQYTFDNNTPTNPADDWKDVLAQIYGGQNHTSSATLIPDATEVNADGTAVCFTATIVNDGTACNATTACPAGQFCNVNTCSHQAPTTTARNCKRNPARIDCSNPVRGVLLSNYGSVISTPVCTTNPALGNCTKVKHAFRRDDLSGTTDAFQALVGLIALPPQTQIRSTAGGNFAPEIADFASTASPFCNGGTAVGNKGFADGTDLDPYRRACTTGPAPNRLGLENVCQAWAAPTNADTGCYVTGGSPAVLSPVNYPQKDRSAPQGRGFVAAGSVDNVAALQNDYFLTTATRPRCLGVVVPISMPLDVPGQNSWDNYRYPLGGTCTSGARGVSNPWAGHTMVCPDGASKSISGSCRLAINTGVSPNRFDCTVDSPLPSGTVSDSRIYNLMPVNKLGHIADTSPAGEGPLQDAYNNPFFPNAPNLRRFARRYYGIHMIRPDNSTGLATTAGPCVDNDDTSQIGCLVKASPCSVGYAGREAADAGPTFANVGLRLTGIQATVTNIQNLATAGTPVYPMARKLWFNSFQPTPAPEVIGFETPNLTADEQTLATCMGLPGKCAVDADCTGANSAALQHGDGPLLLGQQRDRGHRDQRPQLRHRAGQRSSPGAERDGPGLPTAVGSSAWTAVRPYRCEGPM